MTIKLSELSTDKKTLLKNNFPEVINWFNKLLDFPGSIIKPKIVTFDYMRIDYIHIDQKNLDEIVDTRCILSFFTNDNHYRIHIIKPNEDRQYGYIFGIYFPRILEEGMIEIPNSDLRDGRYSEATLREILKQIMSIERKFPELIKLSDS